MILFQFGVSLQLASVHHGERLMRCDRCGKLRRYFVCDGVELHFHLPLHPERLKQWPMIGGQYHTIVQKSVAEALLDAGITGFKLHKPTAIHQNHEDFSKMPPIPNYYLLETTGLIDFVVPENEYEPPCPECGHLKPKRFGNPEKPFVFLEGTWDGSDIVRIRNHWQHIIFFNRKVVDLFRINGWHHQIAYGQNGKRYESINFGGVIAPGVSVRNIDSDNWYEDTLAALREKWPEQELS